MAQNFSRSQNEDLAEGMSDGKYKKMVQDRGGQVDEATYMDRAALSDVWYGMHEAPVKVLPDGTLHVTPETVPTPAVAFP